MHLNNLRDGEYLISNMLTLTETTQKTACSERTTGRSRGSVTSFSYFEFGTALVFLWVLLYIIMVLYRKISDTLSYLIFGYQAPCHRVPLHHRHGQFARCKRRKFSTNLLGDAPTDELHASNTSTLQNVSEGCVVPRALSHSHSSPHARKLPREHKSVQAQREVKWPLPHVDETVCEPSDLNVLSYEPAACNQLQYAETEDASLEQKVFDTISSNSSSKDD